MRYSEFLDYVKEHILEYLPEEYATAEVDIHPVAKNNGLQLDALLVKKQGVDISPTIYLNQMYDALTEGKKSLEDTMEKIAAIRKEHDSEISVNTADLSSYEWAKDRVVMRVINKDYNQAMLADLPHKEVGNLAIIYAVVVEMDGDGFGSYKVTNALMENWGIKPDELHDLAMKNSPELLPPTFRTMKEIMVEDMGMPEEMFPDFGGPQMNILSNEQKVNGASSLFYPGMMEQIGQKLGSDFVVLPSSIHEVIVLPVDPAMDKEGLISMVKEVNSTSVDPDEVLADTAYYYDKENGLFYDLGNEKGRENAIQTDMGYMESLASEIYDKTAENPTREGKEAYLEEVRENVNEKGYSAVLAELKDKQASAPMEPAREMEIRPVESEIAN